MSMAEEVEATAVEKFGSLSEAFRSIIETGDKALAKLHLPVELSPALKLRLESELLKRRYVEKRRIEVFFTDPDGVEKLRAIGRKYAEDKKGQSSVTVRTISSPRYEIVVESKRPKKAEAMAEEIVEKVIAEAKSLGGNVRT